MPECLSDCAASHPPRRSDQYPGQWVFLENNEAVIAAGESYADREVVMVAADGEDLVKCFETARRVGFQVPFVVRVPPKEEWGLPLIAAAA